MVVVLDVWACADRAGSMVFGWAGLLRQVLPSHIRREGGWRTG